MTASLLALGSLTLISAIVSERLFMALVWDQPFVRRALIREWRVTVSWWLFVIARRRWYAKREG